MGQFKNKTISLFVLFLLILPYAGCVEKRETQKPSATKSAAPKPFIIALLPARNVFLQKKRYQPLADYLSKALDMHVSTKILDSYEAIYGEMLKHKVDAAVFGSLSFVIMNSKIPLDTLARPYKKDGISTYKGVIFALKDRGITGEVRTWKGKRIALVSKSTTAGYMFPKWYLYKKGIKNFESYFSKVIYTGSHDAAIHAVVNNDTDIGCTSDMAFQDSIEKNPSMREKLMILAISASVPLDTLGVREDMDGKLKEKLKTTLLGLDKTPEGRAALSQLGAEGFIETKESEFAPIFEMLDDLGLKPDDFVLETVGKH